MHWSVQVTVNILWIVFFLTLDPYSESVQRRSTEEGVTREFCLQLPQENNLSERNKTNMSEETTNSNLLSTPRNDESITTVNAETTSPPTVLDLTSKETTSTQSSDTVRLNTLRRGFRLFFDSPQPAGDPPDHWATVPSGGFPTHSEPDTSVEHQFPPIERRHFPDVKAHQTPPDQIKTALPFPEEDLFNYDEYSYDEYNYGEYN